MLRLSRIVAMNPHLALNILSLPIDIYYCIQELTPINAFINTSQCLGDVKTALILLEVKRECFAEVLVRTQLLKPGAS
jgi:hypothetical protein